MCVIAVAHLASQRYPLIVAANRDERHERESAPADWWPDAPGLLGGRDLVAGGSWLAVSDSGRFAAVTNIFERPLPPAERSRGALVSEFLRSDLSATEYSRRIQADEGRYAPFNLLFLESGQLHFCSNRNPTTALAPGLHTCSSNRPGADWPKLSSLEAALRNALSDIDPAEQLLEHLSGPQARGTLDAAPESLFIVGTEFGTRCSTVLIVDRDGHVRFIECRFLPDGETAGTASFEFLTPTSGCGHRD